MDSEWKEWKSLQMQILNFCMTTTHERTHTHTHESDGESEALKMKRKKEPAKARDEYNEKFRCISQKRSECCTWDAHTLFMPYIQLFFMRCRIVFWCMVSGIGRQYFKLCSVIWMCISHSTLSLCVLHSTLPACLPSSSTSSSSLLCVLEKKSHLNFFSHVFWTLKFKFSFLFCLFACLSSCKE